MVHWNIIPQGITHANPDPPPVQSNEERSVGRLLIIHHAEGSIGEIAHDLARAAEALSEAESYGVFVSA